MQRVFAILSINFVFDFLLTTGLASSIINLPGHKLRISNPVSKGFLSGGTSESLQTLSNYIK
jgi:hypothetical protein